MRNPISTTFEILQTNSTTTTTPPPPINRNTTTTAAEGITMDPLILLLVMSVIGLTAFVFMYLKHRREKPIRIKERIFELNDLIEKASGYNLGGYLLSTAGVALGFIIMMVAFAASMQDEPIMAVSAMIGVGGLMSYTREKAKTWYRERKTGINLTGNLRTMKGEKFPIFFRNVKFRELYPLSNKRQKELIEKGIPKDVVETAYPYPTMIQDESLALFIFSSPKSEALEPKEEPDIDHFGTDMFPTVNIDMLFIDTMTITVKSTLEENLKQDKEIPVIRVLYDDARALKDIQGLDDGSLSSAQNEVAMLRAEIREDGATASDVNVSRRAFTELAEEFDDTDTTTQAIAMSKAQKRYQNKTKLAKWDKIKEATGGYSVWIVILVGICMLALGLALGYDWGIGAKIPPTNSTASVLSLLNIRWLLFMLGGIA